MVQQLLQHNPGLYIIATSREAFGMQGEAVCVVPSLSFPDPACLPPFDDFTIFEAVRLFEERTRTINSEFRLTEQNALSIASICQHLDGIPLAIERAASRANLLTPEQIAVRLGDVFGLLSSRRRTSLPRHQTLLAAIRWSEMIY